VWLPGRQTWCHIAAPNIPLFYTPTDGAERPVVQGSLLYWVWRSPLATTTSRMIRRRATNGYRQAARYVKVASRSCREEKAECIRRAQSEYHCTVC
jgi:hypothetical protein